MGRYELDMTQASATVEILPKGDYEFQIGEPKAFKGTNQKNEENYGVRLSLTVADALDGADTTKKGAKIPYSLYLHSQGAADMAKRFVMAALGFPVNRQGEKEFNERYRGADWAIDPETGGCGEIWRSVAGKRVICSVDIGKNPNTGDEQQQWKQWKPLTA